ncbi:hypothetical protein R1flu_011643 [Riccia fluitans]|uniref:Myb/SANT-like DNA-binding domain-containing protein n=1 Tax=Riccia fluitans TaxID=41844 RepID=A0ABD1Z8S1_9MARC
MNENLQWDGIWCPHMIHHFLSVNKDTEVDHLNFGNLTKRHWERIVVDVNKYASRFGKVYTQPQLKNKLDALKKTFKEEKKKKRDMSGEEASTWQYYDRMWELEGKSLKIVGIPNSRDNGGTSSANTFESTDDSLQHSSTVIDLNDPPSQVILPSRLNKKRQTSNNNAAQPQNSTLPDPSS